MTKFVTFVRWSSDPKVRTQVTVNPTEVSDVEDYCGNIEPGSVITLKNRKTYLVSGTHAEIVARLLSAKDSVI